ncbi:hypothetical protein GCM10022247_04390 [Allokutzneria multivorans]|uniref:eCIS core domain-containing protein n=1 Tax=Allokutzneria multivorans TaxID=1142134 RepID=A0ABP7QW77_9PSEU
MRWSWPWASKRSRERVIAAPPRVRQAWRHLPALGLTFKRAAPLVGLSELRVIHPLIHAPTSSAKSSDAPRGIVEGITTVVPVQADEQPVQLVELPPPVHRVVPVRRTPTIPERLVLAEPRFVGEPREPEQPHRPPAWLNPTPFMPLPEAPPPEPAPRPQARPRRNLGQSRRLGLGAPIPQVPAADEEEEPEAALPLHQQLLRVKPPTVERVPPDLAARVTAAHGTDVSDVTVHRGPEVSAEAASRGTRAFTRDGTVFLPAEAGPIDAPEVRGLLGHELTHVVQQRMLGPALPEENSAHGLSLELQAMQGGEWAAGTKAQPPELRHAPPRERTTASSGAVQHELPHDKIMEIARGLAKSELRDRDDYTEPDHGQVERWFETVRDAGGVTAHKDMDDHEIRAMAKKLVDAAIRMEGTGRAPSFAEVDSMQRVLKHYLDEDSADSGAAPVEKYESWSDLRRGVAAHLLTPFNDGERDMAEAVLGKGMKKLGLGGKFSTPEQEKPTAASWTAPWAEKDDPKPAPKAHESWGELMGDAGSSVAKSLLQPYGIDLSESEDRTLRDMASHPSKTAHWLWDNARGMAKARSTSAWSDWEPSPAEETEHAVETAKRNNGKNEMADMNFDQLVHQIYQRVRSALREELIVGRERAGHLSDPR